MSVFDRFVDRFLPRKRSVRIYFSYRRSDDQGGVGRLYDYLSQHFGKGQVFLDVDSLHFGVDFRRQVAQAISKATCMLVIIGPNWVRSMQDRFDDPNDFVRLEIEIALERGIRIIPVLMGYSINMPKVADLPESISRLTYLHVMQIDMQRDFALDVRRLIKVLEETGARGRVDDSRASRFRRQILDIADRLSAVKDLGQISAILKKWPPDNHEEGLSASHVKKAILEIVSREKEFQLAITPNQRATATELLEITINRFIDSARTWAPPLSVFSDIGEKWLDMVVENKHLIRDDELPQVFRAAEYVLLGKEAFLPRYQPLGELEAELKMSQRSTAVLIYGRRRMGKSTFVHNIQRFLPEQIKGVVMSCLDPKVVAGEHQFGNAVRCAIEPIAGDLAKYWEDRIKSLAGFSEFLHNLNQWLLDKNWQLLLSIDEYELLDDRIGRKVFSEEFLWAIRDSIQQHDALAWAFVGAHDIAELEHADWTSFLIGLRTIELKPFSLKETEALLTQPLKFASDRDLSKRRTVGVFESGFWGESGIERIHSETGGWCYFVQAVAANVVRLCNERDLDHASEEVVEQGITDTVESANNVFSNLLLENSTRHPDAWNYLQGFRREEVRPEPSDEVTRRLLKRHLLVEEVEQGHLRLRIPIMQKWVSLRG